MNSAGTSDKHKLKNADLKMLNPLSEFSHRILLDKGLPPSDSVC